ncbi:DNA topoisomerase IB (plasmid) [Rhizobium leguminosarum]|uniref:DNA topoisomerase n=1 Tax=Rhizobium leguminosarum TaxID=384 RepID=A0A444IHE7_RHILE|nr:DNA topoisomerase IB [Rhizobium leguminosarum]MDH6663689.1 DNA topoisomerase-1 [Rhizobium sophorae]ASS59360.1 DNA topoisomerase [Rhizobium leguminosarum bv. viciae]AVC47588.1 eukaryotic DNA topoisomerase I, catalytic core family protein [Rhizobium leguminosarum bv. viciae]MBB4331157.1 DNA topoisomerase-1 [Rhizobium leguminosarum]MBB4346043.1 DNA topoisomerase-1 [Rhizobium leguminosarum]
MNAEAITDLGLVYVSDTEPGIRRRRKGKGFSYVMPDGTTLADELQRARIGALGLPPAYENVWICLYENGHLQATGFDARGRKQYRYHKEWQSFRSAGKFHQLIEFGRALPRIRRTVLRHLDTGAEDVNGVLAALTTLLDEAHLRVGNQAYVRENGTYGATTLLKRHLKIVDGQIELKFRAKGGKRVQRSLKHPRLQKILEEIADLPGRQLFVWKDESGALKPIDSGRLNAYLAEISGIPISAKTFRTWAGSLAAFGAARETIVGGGRPTVKQMSEAAAEALHNTPAISRSSYIHPAIIALASNDHPLIENGNEPLRGLRAEENRLLDFLTSEIEE